MSRRILCNASPLIFLSKINRLHLLSDLFDETLIPESAWNEATCKPDDASKRIKEVLATDQFTVFVVNNKTAVLALNGRLHIGEVEVIIGAGELGIKDVILDDGYARSKAKQMGLSVTGTLGILLAGCEAGILSDINSEIYKLLGTGFRISDSILTEIRKRYGS